MPRSSCTGCNSLLLLAALALALAAPLLLHGRPILSPTFQACCAVEGDRGRRCGATPASVRAAPGLLPVGPPPLQALVAGGVISVAVVGKRRVHWRAPLANMLAAPGPLHSRPPVLPALVASGAIEARAVLAAGLALVLAAPALLGLRPAPSPVCVARVAVKGLRARGSLPFLHRATTAGMVATKVTLGRRPTGDIGVVRVAIKVLVRGQ
mmetsp:Transcript_29208/g.67926  ORF Transcript_29208/g.67926 Transcript_29208/m.67926 type:complete len:210 (+) Transcript_29208:100-729(+)